MGRKPNRNADEALRKGLTRANRDDLNKLVSDLLESRSIASQCLRYEFLLILVHFVECAVSGTSSPAKDWEIYMETCSLLEKIAKIELVLERPPVDRKGSLTPFTTWLATHGARMCSVELVDLPFYGYSVRALTPIKMGDLVFSIPHELLLSVETAKASSIGIKSIFSPLKPTRV